jgi:superfamily II DNA/RNA helicase
MSVSISNASGFGRLPLHADLARAVREAGFIEPRPIQSETIPAALEGAEMGSFHGRRCFPSATCSS